MPSFNYLFKKNHYDDFLSDQKSLISLSDEPSLFKQRKKDFFSEKKVFSLKKDSRQVKEEDVYEDNGGTTLILKIDNKIIIAADTRLNSEYNINTRHKSKIYRIGDFFLTAVGFQADCYDVYIKLLYQVQNYETRGKMGLKALAHYLCNVLYSRRFFPLYSYCTLAGYEEGKARVYSFDCVGSYQEVSCRVDGTGCKMIQPLLDSWIEGKNFDNFQGINAEEGLKLVKKAFDSASQSDVKTGDFLEIKVFDGESVLEEMIELRKD